MKVLLLLMLQYLSSEGFGHNYVFLVQKMYPGRGVATPGDQARSPNASHDGAGALGPVPLELGGE